jgi:hypothetical protein
VHFRRIGDPDWHSGQAENVSRSGVLFRSKDSLPLQATVEVRFTLTTVRHQPTTEVVCRGRVVRTISPSNEQRWSGAAVLVEDYDTHPIDMIENEADLISEHRTEGE